MVIDDSMMYDLARANDYFCRARNQNINIIFITKSFTKLRRSTIRINFNAYLVFWQPDTLLLGLNLRADRLVGLRKL